MSEINGYYLTEKWFSFMSENNQIVQCKHTAVYLYIVEMFNKRQWVKRIGLPTDFTIGALSISYKTYKGVLEDLVKFGFLKIEWSKNQYSSNQIELVKIPKAELKHIPKLNESKGESEYQSEFSIYKTYKHLNIKQINSILSFFDKLPKDQIDIYISNLTKENPNEIFPETESVEPGAEERKKVAPKKEKYFNKDDFKKKLLELGVKEKHANDWIQIRKDKRASFTESAIDGIIRECEKHNFPFPEAIRNCAESNWQGFKYEWIKNKNQNSNGITNTTNAGFSTSKPSTNNGNSGKRSYRQILAERLTNELKANGEGSNITIDAEICE